jgi:hypothetical protein
MQKFYILKNFKLIGQIKSNWCWAACGAMIANYFEINVGRNSLLDFVKKGISNNCTIHNTNCNKTLSPEKIEKLYENEFNINCIKRNPTYINNFNFIKQTLKKNKSPLVGGISLLGKVNHLILIVGYGYCNNKNYLLIFDPKGSKLYTEYENNIFLHQESNFNLLWETKLKSGNNNKSLHIVNNINEFINPNYELEASYIILNDNILLEKKRLVTKSLKKSISIYRNTHFSITSLNSEFKIDCDSKIEIFVANPLDIKEMINRFKSFDSKNIKLTTFDNFHGIFSLTEVNGLFHKNYNIPSEIINLHNYDISKLIKKLNK